MVPENIKENLKIDFIGLNPSRPLIKYLSKIGFEIVINNHLKTSNADIVIINVKSFSDLKILERIKKERPNLWSVFVVNRKFLTKPKWKKNLLANKGKNDVLFLDNWENALPFSIQKFSEQKNILLTLKRLSINHNNLKKRCVELSKESSKLIEKLENDINMAVNIQRAIIPKTSPQIPGISVSVKYFPATGAGGDYYDVFAYGDNKRYGFIVADSETHGVAAALLSTLLKLNINEMRERFTDSNLFVDYLNNEIAMNFSFEKKAYNPTMSLFFGIFDRTTLSMKVTIAGNISHILWRNKKVVYLPKNNNPPINKQKKVNFNETIINFEPGDFFIVYTDGLEAAFPNSNELALNSLTKLLSKFPPEELETNIMGVIDAYKEKNKLCDDITVLNFSVDKRAIYIASRN